MSPIYFDFISRRAFYVKSFPYCNDVNNIIIDLNYMIFLYYT